jgi:hypothetical protein
LSAWRTWCFCFLVFFVLILFVEEPIRFAPPTLTVLYCKSNGGANSLSCSFYGLCRFFQNRTEPPINFAPPTNIQYTLIYTTI